MASMPSCSCALCLLGSAASPACVRWSRSQTKPMRMLGGVSANGPSCSPIVSASTNQIGAVLATCLGSNDYNPLLQSRRRRLAELNRNGPRRANPTECAGQNSSVCSLGWSSYLREIAELERWNGMRRCGGRCSGPGRQDDPATRQPARHRRAKRNRAGSRGPLYGHFPNGKARSALLIPAEALTSDSV